jgi:HlyD family secretion protein
MIKINSVVAGLLLVGLIGSGTGLAALQVRGARPVQTAGRSSGVQPLANDPGAQDAPKNGGQPAPVASNPTRTSSADVYSHVASTIIAIRPNGSTVKKGEVVCELDSAALKNQLINQKITVESAKANFENAKLLRENAEIAVVEYEEGLYKMQVEEVVGDIKIAEAELALAEDELKQDKDLAVSKGIGKLEVKRRELAVLRARFGLEKAQKREKLLRDFTRPKKLKALKSKVVGMRSNELAKQATWELERGKEKKLVRQIASCEIKAPRDGTIVYLNEMIDEGLLVRERQSLFTIVPTSAATPKAN